MQRAVLRFARLQVKAEVSRSCIEATAITIYILALYYACYSLYAKNDEIKSVQKIENKNKHENKERKK